MVCVVFHSKWMTGSGVCCIPFKMDDSLSLVSKCIKWGAVIEFLAHENETHMEIHWQLLASYGKDTVDIHTVRCWVRKLRGSGRNVACHCKLTM